MNRNPHIVLIDYCEVDGEIREDKVNEIWYGRLSELTESPKVLKCFGITSMTQDGGLTIDNTLKMTQVYKAKPSTRVISFYSLTEVKECITDIKEYAETLKLG